MKAVMKMNHFLLLLPSATGIRAIGRPSMAGFPAAGLARQRLPVVLASADNPPPPEVLEAEVQVAHMSPNANKLVHPF